MINTNIKIKPKETLKVIYTIKTHKDQTIFMNQGNQYQSK